MVISIVGHPAAGKDSAADYFVTKGFANISTGDFLRELMQNKGVPIDRPHLREFVKEMRAKEGNGFPANEVVASITGNSVVSGFRNLAEVDIFRKKFGKDFVLIAIDADVEVRYQRILSRNRIGDDLTLERFKEEEDAERMEQSGSHEVDRVIAAADHVIKNNGAKEDFFIELEKVFQNLKKGE